MKCKKHPKYKAIRKPTSGCVMCWAIFLGMCETCLNAGCQCEPESHDEWIDRVVDPPGGH